MLPSFPTGSCIRRTPEVAHRHYVKQTGILLTLAFDLLLACLVVRFIHSPNGVIDASFDGWPTFIAFAASLITYVGIALVTPRSAIRGLDVRLADDVDDAHDGIADENPDLITVEAGQQ